MVKEKMLKQPTTYEKADIFNYLRSRNYEYAADCWAEDKGLCGGILSIDTAKWFKRYFPAGTSAIEFAYMESVNTPYLN
jgi:hypothetical protein